MPEMDIIAQLSEAILLPLEYFTVSSKRTYYVFLVSSLLMALYVFFKCKKEKGLIHYILNKDVWLSNSAITDYLILFFNGFTKVFLIAPFAFLGVYLQNFTSDILIQFFGVFNYDFSVSLIVIFYTISIWLIGDFASFFLHFLMHKTPFLWEFHKTHHSATVLNPFTQYRIHPVELFLVNIKGFVVYGLVTGVFFYFSGGEVGTITFIGVNIFRFGFLFFGANLRHSHVKFTFFNWLEYIFISPFQHQIHHSDSQEHFNKNLGSQLAIWDWLFGTLITSKETKEITFGLGEKENTDFNTFAKSILMPFRNLFKR